MNSIGAIDLKLCLFQKFDSEMGKQHQGFLCFFRVPEFLKFTGIPEVKVLKHLPIKWTFHLIIV